VVSGELHIIVIISHKPLTLAEKYFACVFLNGEKTARCMRIWLRMNYPKRSFIPRIGREGLCA
jgi:hypothetical protein